MTNTQLEAFLTLPVRKYHSAAGICLSTARPESADQIVGIRTGLYAVSPRERTAPSGFDGRRAAISRYCRRYGSSLQAGKKSGGNQGEIHAAYLRNTRPILLFSAGRIYPFSQGPTGCRCGIGCCALYGGISAACPRAGGLGTCKFSYCRTVRCQCASIQRTGRSVVQQGSVSGGGHSSITIRPIIVNINGMEPGFSSVV